MRVLRQFSLPTIDVHAVSPLGRKQQAKARLIIDHIIEMMMLFSGPI